MLTQINYELQKANIISPTVKSSSLYGSLAQTVLEAIDTVNNLGKDYWLNNTSMGATLKQIVLKLAA
ncbi:MAG: hypothetical protein MK076_05280 [Flavobacteriales bacterium]|nr:hypothetical protein [Flavobacteriales bacterium]